MEDQKKSNTIVSKIWSNWCKLDPAQRSEVATRLGPVGYMLSIAANITAFAQKGAEIVDSQGSGATSTKSASPSSNPAASHEEFSEDDIIDVEFEEYEP